MSCRILPKHWLWGYLKHLAKSQNFFLQLTHLRRQRAIRRCLFMATVQMILNTPYYTLQLIDEVYSLHPEFFRSTPTGLLTYLYMDAVLYLLYLCQFPLVSLYISALHSDMKSCDR
ncbi:unnamed protein product [Haemonchus placei]|uniref:G_PROTEIN_RECEP_F1_2 domain-containing protein n=1 Tax=Haemonchus placei TaxID=6290 RepID=A0A0N4X1B7_HAEPC|nr:unnamed protein product [Haemonchus placei]